jgi:glycosyltransferase involved in cell wall biosynthesis
VDDSGRVLELSFARRCLQWLRHFAFRVVDPTLWVSLRLVRLLPPAVAGRERPAVGNVAIVLPILPDLSHTFVYREVVALRALDPSIVVVALEEGHGAVVHPEAASLLAHAKSLRLRGIASRAWLILRTVFASPRRTRALLDWYRGEDIGKALLGKLPLCEGRHPGRAFELAAALRGANVGQIHVYGSTWAANVAIGAGILLDRPVSISSYVDFEFPYLWKCLPQKLAAARFFRVQTADCRRRLRALLPTVDDSIAAMPVLPYGVDAAAFRARPPAPPPKLDPAALRLVSACRVVPKKGMDRMPPLLLALRARGIRAHWQLAGDGPELARVRALALELGVSDQIEFLGPLPNDRLLEVIAAADVAILPSIEQADGERDGLPVFLIEAMALGRLAHSTPVSAIPELIVDGVTGLLSSADPEALADRLAAALADPVRARAIAAAGRDAALTTSDSARSAQELLTRLRAADADPTSRRRGGAAPRSS